MANLISDIELNQIDEFISEKKFLVAGHPEWKQAAWVRDKEAIWNIEDSIGVVSAHLRFRYTYVDEPSISLIFRGNNVWRIDFAPNSLCKPSPPDAHLFGLPPVVCGSHEHSWIDNRSFIARRGYSKGMPYRLPVASQIRRLPQALAHFCDLLNIELTPLQRSFDTPSEQELPF